MSEVNDLVRDVLAEAFGATATPFVPLPFVDDWILARLMRRIAGKVLARSALDSPGLAKAIVHGYVKEGASPLAKSILVGAARFVVRKVAVVLDVKRSHDVFGESIAFALAVDLAAREGWATEANATRLGGAIHRALESSGSGALEAVARAGREAFANGKRGELAEAISAQVASLQERVESALRLEMGRAASM